MLAFVTDFWWPGAGVTGMDDPVPACPAVVPTVVVAGGWRYDAALAVQNRDHVRKFGFVVEGHNKFCVGRRYFGGEGAVCLSESHDRSAITSRSGGEVGDGIHRLLLIKVIIRLVFLLVKAISRLETGAGGSDLRFAPFLVSGCEEGFKGRPCFSSRWQALTGFAVVKEKASLED